MKRKRSCEVVCYAAAAALAARNLQWVCAVSSLSSAHVSLNVSIHGEERLDSFPEGIDGSGICFISTYAAKEEDSSTNHSSEGQFGDHSYSSCDQCTRNFEN